MAAPLCDEAMSFGLATEGVRHPLLMYQEGFYSTMNYECGINNWGNGCVNSF